MEEYPYPHIIIPNFLGDVAPVLDAVSTLSFEEKSSDLFHFFQSKDLKNNETFAPLVDYLNNDFAKKIGELFEKDLYLSDLFCSIYQDTDFLLCHDDQLDNRKFAFILYLNTLEPQQGGALVLYNKDFSVAKKIQPTHNTLALFEVSDISFHAVEEVIANVQRIALTGWLS